MASPPVLDIGALLAPISGDEPAGTPMPFTLRQKLDDARQEEEKDPDDPTKIVPKKAEWAWIIRTTTELLTESSKDLRLASRLTEALARQHGFVGLRDGIHLLHDLIDQCWDRCHPIPEEGEGLEVRATPFHWLSDAEHRPFFPSTVRRLPLLRVDGEEFGWQDHKDAQEGTGRVAKESLDQALPVSDQIDEDVTQTRELLDRLEQVLNTRFQESAPTMFGLAQAVDDCQQLVRFYLRRLGLTTEEAPAAAPSADGGVTGPPAAGGVGVQVQPGANRSELYRQVGQIADALERLEPHSPIPFLLRRAVELGLMPFRQLIRELVRDEGRLTELRREFGIKEPEHPAEGA